MTIPVTEIYNYFIKNITFLLGIKHKKKVIWVFKFLLNEESLIYRKI